MGAECSTLAPSEMQMQPSQHPGAQLKGGFAEISRPLEYSKTEANLSSASTTHSNLSKQISCDSVSTRLGELSLLVDPKEVIVKKELCTTCKSTVSIASWRGHQVAAKQLKLDRESGDIALKDLMNEIAILSEIHHPRLVRLMGANLDETGPLLLTELLESQDVETYMRKQRMSSAEGTYKPCFTLAMRWALNTGEALAYLHGLSQPIIHRDLKPLNMFLTRNLEVKVGDFGLAKVMPSTDRAHMSGGIGTWRYMAPEVVRYEQYDEKIDIYAFSLIMYFLFSGKQPFHSFGKDPRTVLEAYRRGEEPRPLLDSSVGSRELRQFLPRVWHIHPNERPSAQECVDALSVMEKPGLRKTLKDISIKLKGKRLLNSKSKVSRVTPEK